MLYAESNYKSVPELLAAFAPEFKTEHFHIHGGAHHNSREDTLLSVIQDDTNQLHRGARLAFKGAAAGLVSAFFYNAKFGGRDNEFLHTRSILNKAYHHFHYSEAGPNLSSHSQSTALWLGFHGGSSMTCS